MAEKIDVLNKWGEATGEIMDRDECHKKGIWHRAISIILVNDNGDVLLQQRSKNKKTWPNMWDVMAGGHVLAGEFGYEAAIRETKEEVGIDITKEDLLYIGSTTSENIFPNIINRHYNEYFVITKKVDIKDIKLQEDEVQDIRWFKKEEVINRIHNNYDGLTEKIAQWLFLEKYLEKITK